MESYLCSDHYDLVTPDGVITTIRNSSGNTISATILIENISPAFVGFSIDIENVHFNFKSVLAQLGLDSICENTQLDSKMRTAEIQVTIKAINTLGRSLLSFLSTGTSIGKLFAADTRRKVRDPDYLSRMFGRSDRWGRPLLSLGGMHGSRDLCLEKIDGRTVAYLTLRKGRIVYEDSIHGFISTILKSLQRGLSLRKLLSLHQKLDQSLLRSAADNEMLLVQALPLHIRTVFAHVVPQLLTPGYTHTAASVLQPDTEASGDIYELYGSAEREISDIPLEFYTLEPHREHVFFSDRDQLQCCLEDPNILFQTFQTKPDTEQKKAAVFVVKGEQMMNLSPSSWIVREPVRYDFPGISQSSRQALMVERYIEHQPSYHFLRAIEDGLITSQGVLLTEYFPSPLMKRMLLSPQSQLALKGIYFQHPSFSHNGFFSQEDRALLLDLAKFAIPVYWVDPLSKKILSYVQKFNKDYGMFVPLDKVSSYLRATVFGIYGSNLMTGDFEDELSKLLQGVLSMRFDMNHPLLNSTTPLALVTGGGPGVMEVGNKVAKELDIVSCANIVDFSGGDGDIVINEQRQNPYIDAKMTYRLEKLIERQAEFNLHFPIFLPGGIGTDFEFTLEIVRRKVGASPAYPILLLGNEEYWHDIITTPFYRDMAHGTIAGSEWISNCSYNIQTAEQGIEIYRQFFEGTLPIGKDSPSNERGFVVVQ